MVDVAPVTGAEAAVAAFAVTQGDALRGAVTLSVCADDATVGLYRSDGAEVVEPIASGTFENAGAGLADALASALALEADVSGPALVKALRDYRSRVGSRHGRALRRLDRSGMDGTCLELGGHEGVSVSASTWARAYERAVYPALDSALEVARGLLRQAGVEGEPLRVILSGEVVDAQALLYVRRKLGSDPRLADRRFPQGEDDGAFEGLVEKGRALFEAGRVSRDRKMPFSLSLTELEGEEGGCAPAGRFALFGQGDPVSSVSGERWSGPLFVARGEDLKLWLNDAGERATVPEGVLGEDGCAIVRVAALVEDGRVLLRIRPADASRAEAVSETGLTVEGM